MSGRTWTKNERILDPLVIKVISHLETHARPVKRAWIEWSFGFDAQPPPVEKGERLEGLRRRMRDLTGTTFKRNEVKGSILRLVGVGKLVRAATQGYYQLSAAQRLLATIGRAVTVDPLEQGVIDGAPNDLQLAIWEHAGLKPGRVNLFPHVDDPLLTNFDLAVLGRQDRKRERRILMLVGQKLRLCMAALATLKGYNDKASKYGDEDSTREFALFIKARAVPGARGTLHIEDRIVDGRRMHVRRPTEPTLRHDVPALYDAHLELVGNVLEGKEDVHALGVGDMWGLPPALVKQFGRHAIQQLTKPESKRKKPGRRPRSQPQ